MGSGRVAGPVIHDISPAITTRLAVFPGDVAYRRDVALDFRRGHHLLLSSISSTVHVGAHADAPNHYHPEGQAIDARPLELYLGGCQLVSLPLPAAGRRLVPADLAAAGVEIREPRVIFRTGSFPDPERWNDDFNALSVELVAWLAGRGVVLVGIDTPSIDLANDKVLEAHQEVFRRDMAILEGLVIGTEVRDGSYTLVALPLRLAGADASPVRAVLVEREGGATPWST